MPKFSGENYAFMRHAEDATDGDMNEILSPDGVEICKRQAARLASQLGDTPVHIRHSPAKRAMLTAPVVKEILEFNGIEVLSVKPLEWLDGRHEKFGERMVLSETSTDGSFTLFITHLPEVSMYLGIELVGNRQYMPNSAIFAQNFEILPKGTPTLS